jgi:hypothetical protein
VAEACATAGLGALGATPSSLPGPAGNVELFLHVREGERGRDLDLDGVIAAASRVQGRAS